MKKNLLSIIALIIVCRASFADIVYVTARPSPCTVTANCPGPNTDGTYSEQNITLGDFGSLGTAVGHPQTTVSRTYVGGTAITDPNAGVTLTPTLGVAGAVYQIDYNYNSTAGNHSTNVIMAAACTAGGTLSFTQTDKFQRSFGNPANQWQLMGYLTNDVGSATPTITFRYLSGTIQANAPGGARISFDCWRFTLAQPCLQVAAVGITGPLATNLQEVVVTGVTNATAVTVYQNSGAGFVVIGTKTTGVTDGNNTVTVAGLVKGAQVGATQTVGGQEGCVPTAGTIVGGGPNPNIRVVFSIRYSPLATGPVGAQGTNGGNVYYGGASAVGGGSSPANGTVLTPSTCWQTVAFNRNTDPSVQWAVANLGLPATLEGDYGSLDGLAIACEGDPGPVDIYIDDIANGSHGIIQDWEGANEGQVYGLGNPRQSGSTDLFLHTLPNQSFTSLTNVYSGTKSYHVRFQYIDGQTTRWVRLVTAANVPVQNPLVDLNQPISVKILVLPAGQTAAHHLAFTTQPQSQTKNAGQSATFTVAADGTPPYSYQWKHEGTNIASATLSSYTVASVAEADAGNYAVAVTDASCTDLSVTAALTVNQQPPNLTISRFGSDVVLEWSGTWTLQSATDVAGTYVDVPGPVTTGPYTNTFTEATQFFRLRN